MATHSVFLPGESHGQVVSVGLQTMGLQRIRCDLVTKQPQQILSSMLCAQ